MTSYGRKTVARMAIASAAATCLLISYPAVSSELPFPAKTIKLAPQQDSVQSTIVDLFTQSGMKVKVSSRVSKSKLAAAWVDKPANIWRQLAKTFNLVAYYDGAVVRIYAADEITSRSFKATSPEGVVADAKKMNIIDASNSVKAGSDSVIASGVPEFLERISQLSRTASAPAAVASNIPAMTPVATESSIVSPQTRPGSMLASYDDTKYELDYRVMARSTARQPYEIRVYFLKYAEAEDRRVNGGDDYDVVPGVATQLQAVMGDGAVQGANVIAKGNMQVRYGNNNNADSVDVSQYGGGYLYPYGPPPQVVEQKQKVPDANGPRISADPDRNAVIVRDHPSAMSSYDGLIRTLDRPKVQLEIEAIILDLDVSKASSFGIDLSLGFSALGGIFGGRIENGSSDGNVGISYLRSPTQFVNAQINMLQNKGYARIEQRPRLVTRENEPAVSDNRQIFPVIAQGERVAEIREYRYGTFLKILPSIAKEKDRLVVQLKIDVRDGNLIGIRPDTNLPIISNAVLSTSADIPQGESLIIGGISIEESSNSKRGLPIIGTRSKNYRKYERVVIITPRIISNRPETLQAASAGTVGDFTPVNLDKKPAKKTKTY